MDYFNHSYAPQSSKPPEIQSGTDTMEVADRNEIQGVFDRLGISQKAEDVLEDEEFADIHMYVELNEVSAKDYWRATVDNRNVEANVELAFMVGDDIKTGYEAESVTVPAYDVFSIKDYSEAGREGGGIDLMRNGI